MQVDIMFLLYLGLAALVLIISLLLKLFPAPKPSGFMGYKSDRSRRNRKLWKHAQNLFPILFLRLGLLLIATAAVWSISPIKSNLIGLGALALILVGGIAFGIYSIEMRLKRYEKRRISSRK